MTNDFEPFSLAIHARFAEMSKGPMYTTTVDGDYLWKAYLAAFPTGTNPIYRERTEHDCSCCKNFIRNVGTLVTIESNGDLRSVWDTPNELDYPYNVVAQELGNIVRNAEIAGVYYTKERQYGALFTNELREGATVKRWNHFCAKIESHQFRTAPDKERGLMDGHYAVFKRGLDEIKPEAVQTVLDLINDNLLYRGDEHLPAVLKFRALQNTYRMAATNKQRTAFAWSHVNDAGARIRNTAIGTLLQDLSGDMPIEHAVRAFEVKVAPANYKRPSALITESMVKDAMKTVTELGIEPSLARRQAKASDLNITNVLWADNSTTSQMQKGTIESVLMGVAKTTPKKKAVENADDISADDFVRTVLPKTQTLELLMKNAYERKLMTLTTAAHDSAPRIFRWNNPFAWSYNGDMTDSIKERVKSAGGNVDAKLRVSLAWFNTDDLDLHMAYPYDGHVYFGNKRGILDVDMNSGFGTMVRDPVENLSWTKTPDGDYEVWVEQYNQRESSDVGFQIEIEHYGALQQFSYTTKVAHRATVPVFKFSMKNDKLVNFEVSPNLVGGSISKEVWGVKTETFVKVNTVMHSPNYWGDDNVGNKHTFFILDECRSESQVRGLYNEYLSPTLEKHRKVFEVLGNKTRCPASDEQLSGVGFSSTLDNRVTFRADGRLFNVNF